MEREIKTTLDGSKTLYINDLDEGYHSHHGALQEAEHIFIKNGIKNINNYEINILEMGFGTGLNLLVTIKEFLKNYNIQNINYFTLEKYPITDKEIYELNYTQHFDFENSENIYKKIHEVSWNENHEILPKFTLSKFECDFFNLKNLEIPLIDLVYFDCFGAKVQPDLWEKPLFEMVKNKMRAGGLLTTYSSKGSVRRILKDLNFDVKKLEGPKGKREMINAVLLDD